MKKVFLLIASAFLMFPAFAQTVTTSEDENTRTIVEETNTPEGRIVTTTVYEKNSVFTNGFWRNWTLSGNLGAQLFYGENDWKVNKLTEMITFPAVDVYLTKWAPRVSVSALDLAMESSLDSISPTLFIRKVPATLMPILSLHRLNCTRMLILNMLPSSSHISAAIGSMPMSWHTPILETSSSDTTPAVSLMLLRSVAVVLSPASKSTLLALPSTSDLPTTSA